ncbi:glypican-6-like [Mizuhopecten yessoensis]|uniref:Glypican-6 n=1 Tax=Mizuhopecten yessoensis TaxID=6573 RepID=A0A210PJ07_MIZYE|nr:glypican-6-like [Mizuhopecten yessoensis]OWF36477.1 Glypican-6 [Mizuhopecten yessoensis]
MAATKLTPCWCVLFILFVGSHGLNLACIEVKRAYIAQGGNEHDVPIQAISGEHLEVCPQGHTCCTRDMEQKLKSLGTKEYAKLVDESFRYVKSTFVSRTRKFDEFFTELLDNAKKDLHEMFVKTYGLLYQQNSDVFANLFKDLRSYYKGTDISLFDALDNFFRNLLRKMFMLLNPTLVFDETFLRCVTSQMSKLKPFGDTPQQLSLKIKRSFVAARTFVQGLAIGRDVVLEVLKIPPTEACTKALMRMMYCPHCRGLTQTKPCNNYCLNTMKGCLAHHAELNQLWNDYIEAMKQLATRLEGPFNIESVVDPIDVQISNAIMTLHDNGEEISDQIKQGCSISQLGRSKRNARSSDANSTGNNGQLPDGIKSKIQGQLAALGGDKISGIPFDPSKIGEGNETGTSHQQYDYGRYGSPRKKQKNHRPNTAAGTNLDRLVKDIKEKVKMAKDFWVQLPYAICNDENLAAQAGNDEDCWNGQDRARYVPEVQKDGIINQINNPEVEVDVNEGNFVIEQQKIQLKIITSKLNTAFNGEEVDWIDTEIDVGYSSYSSGMGSGDDYSIDGSGAGSGDGGSGSGDGWTGDDEDDLPRRPNKDRRPGNKDRNRNKGSGRDKTHTDDNFFIGPEYGVNTNDGNGFNPPPRTETTPTPSAAVPQTSVSWTCLSILVITVIKTAIDITL